MNYQDFKKYQLTINKQALRLDELNPYLLIPTFSERISVLPNKHSANEGFYIKKSTGVRQLLKELLKHFSELGYQINLPDDVYPEYFNLVPQGSNVMRYRSYAEKEFSFFKDKLSVSLITNPIIPEGRYLTDTELDKLDRWLLENKENWIIFDNVYDYQLKSLDFEFKSKRIVFINSLAKINLKPQTFGWSLCKTKLPGFNTGDKITFDHKLSLHIQQKYSEAWSALEQKLNLSRQFNWSPPQVGYLSIVEKNFHSLLREFNIAAIPITIFGGTRDDHSVISCLSEII